MIDIHNHILYDCDDGVKSIEESICILKKASDLGYTDLVFTPHYMQDGYKNNLSEINDKCELIKERLKQENIRINLFIGEEVFIFPDLYKTLVDGIITSINNSRYVLIEFPLIEELNYIENVIYELTASRKSAYYCTP